LLSRGKIDSLTVISYGLRLGGLTEEDIMGPLATANQQIRHAERESVQARLARLTEPHRLTDRLLDQLEELNLDGIKVVPDRFGTALADVREQLAGHESVSERLLDRLQPGLKTSELIETVFAIQEVIAPPTLAGEEFPFDDVALM
jgi:hypothetical protein